MSILIPVPVPHTQTTLDIEGVRYLLMDPEVLRKAISAHPSISAERVTSPGHCYDPSDWEYTMPWDGRNDLVDDWEVNKVHRVGTLIDGPDKWVVLCWDEVNGEEIRWFDSEADATAAILAALTEAE